MNHHGLQRYIKGIKGFLSRAGNDPYFDWSVILGLFFIVAIALAALSANLFFSINADENAASKTATEDAAKEPSDQILNTDDLTNLISIFQSKSAQAPVFTASYPGPSDPALPIKSVAAKPPAK